MMKASKLEKLLLDGTPLFQERHISLVVEKGSAYSPSEDDNGTYLVDISDGVAWMLGLFLEGDDLSTVDTANLKSKRSLLATLQDHTITGIHILTARVCVYRCGKKLCPILYIHHCRPIHRGHTTPMSRQLDDIQSRPDIKNWLERFEQGTDEYFLAHSIQDEFCSAYRRHVEQQLGRITTAFATSGTPTSSDTSGDASHTGTPLPSAVSLTYQQQQQQLIPPSRQTSPSSSLGPYFPSTATWEDFQRHMLDVFGNAKNSLLWDGYIPITHKIWEQKETTSTSEDLIPEFFPTTPAISMDEQQAPATMKDDWSRLFLDVISEKTEYGRLKKLNAAKMEWMATDTTLTLE